jgi:hypothetical protein
LGRCQGGDDAVRGAVHRFDDTRDLDVKALAVVTPGIVGPDYFLELATIVDAAAGDPPDFAALARSCAGTDSPPLGESQLSPTVPALRI